MSRFSECLQFILEKEGGYVNHPYDRGGATNKGITQSVYDAYRASKGWPLHSVKYLLPDETADIYRSKYWKPAACDKLPAPLDLVVFDGAVNHGVKQSAKFLQRALGVDDDGIIGPDTLGSLSVDVKAGMLTTICEDILKQRKAFYEKLVENDSRQSVFLKGWLNRLDSVRRKINE